MTRSRVVAFLSVVSLFVASAAYAAGEKGLVSNAGGLLRPEPKPKAKKGDKLKQGTMVDVVDHSPDGLWVKVVATGPDGSLEGWVEKTYVRSLSRYGFTWERKSVAGGNQTTGKPVAADPPVTEKGTTTTAEPATTEEGWGNETGTTTEAADSEWEKTDAPAVDATPAPAGAATPVPAEDEGWGAEADLTE